jgi:transcriptional regulator with XRE-family HTH domain
MFNGTKLRNLRKEKGMSLQELSACSGVSAGMISQIERGNADPTMTTLYKICKGLNITLAALIDDEKEQDDVVQFDRRVVRRDLRKTIILPNSKVKYQLLSSSLKNDIEMLLVELEPNQQDRKLITHHGEECGFVMQGKLLVILGEEEYLLNEGDSISFKSTIPHRFINPGNEKSISIWAMTPPSF